MAVIKMVSMTMKQAEHALYIARSALEQHVKIMQEGSREELEYAIKQVGGNREFYWFNRSCQKAIKDISKAIARGKNEPTRSRRH